MDHLLSLRRVLPSAYTSTRTKVIRNLLKLKQPHTLADRAIAVGHFQSYIYIVTFKIANVRTAVTSGSVKHSLELIERDQVDARRAQSRARS